MSGTERDFAYLIVFVVDGANLRPILSTRIAESYHDLPPQKDRTTDYVLSAEGPTTLGKQRMCLREGSKYGRYGQCYRWDGTLYAEER